MASPGVAGLAAILVSNGVPFYECVSRIARTCDKIDAVAHPYAIVAGHDMGTWNQYLGYGRINHYRAMCTLVAPTLDSANPGVGAVDLSWTAPALFDSPTAGYNIYRTTTAGGPYGLVASLGNVTSYTDISNQGGFSFYYTIKAVDSYGFETRYSNELSAIPVQPTLTFTPTISETWTVSPTFTSTSTVTATFSPTNTPTCTITRTYSRTPTDTRTGSPTFSRTATPTVTRTGTLTASPSVSPTFSFSPSASATGSATPSATASFSATASASKTSSPSASLTPTISATNSPSPSISATLTPTSTSTPTASVSETFTDSPTFTYSPTYSLTFTYSPTSTITQTGTETATPTGTPTESPDYTATFTPTITLTFMPTATAVVASNEPLIIQKLLLVPNPLYGNDARLAVKLQGSATRFTLRAYSSGYNLMQKREYVLAGGPGWVVIPVDAGKWPNGVLFLRLTAENGAGTSSALATVFVVK